MKRQRSRDGVPVASFPMQRFVVRVWLPDRPGALGQVASRIGSVRGDVVGIEILERGAGRAIDELVVELHDDTTVDLLVTQIADVDGVDVEDVRPLVADRHADELEALEAAAHLVEQWGPQGDQLLCEEVGRLLEADWSLVASIEPSALLAVRGNAPALPWLQAFIEGSRHLGADADAAPADLAWAEMPNTGRLVAAGRASRAIRWRERATLTLVARVADGLGQLDPSQAGPGPSQPGASQRSDRSTARRQPA